MSFLLDEEKTWLQRDFGLDRRLIKALSKLGFTYPTLVQAKTIPIALQGKDILVRARTGSGKTVAFSLPILQKILSQKELESSSSAASIKCVILAPTKELIKQIETHVTDLIYYCRENITICSLIDDNVSVQQYRLQSKPDIVISTPARLAQQLKANKVDLSSVNTLVVDEADLVLSFGYAEDVHSITNKMPKIFQGILTSATLSAELDKFKRVILHNPAILKLEEPKGVGHLLQFYLEATEQEKFLIIYVFIKLGLLQGKGLIFVNDVNKCYRLKLFFQQFFISAAVLNAEVPLNSRIHILEEYNRGVFDYLIATDASVDQGEADEKDEDESDGEEELDEGEDGDEGDSKKRSKASKKGKKSAKPTKKAKGVDEDGYGVSRGIDFQGVNFVINFDFPLTSAAYTHRIGRTARGTASGTSLSFVTKVDPSRTETAEAEIAVRDHEVLQQVRSQQPRLGIVEGDNVLAAISSMDDPSSLESNEREESRMQPAPLLFNMNELENFRYRVEDTLRSVTSTAVRELRSAEIKNEILNSDKLKSFFAENPNDLKVLRHDKAIMHPIRQKDHLKFVPQYLIPNSMKSVASVNNKKKGRAKKRKTDNSTADDRVQKSKMNDPLRNLSSSAASEEQQHESHDAADDNGGEDDGGDGDEGAVFDVNSSQSQGGMSGRKDWKERHKKGKFNPLMMKHNEHRQAGSFIKSKNYK